MMFMPFSEIQPKHSRRVEIIHPRKKAARDVEGKETNT
jgi:hypothetical protein